MQIVHDSFIVDQEDNGFEEFEDPAERGYKTHHEDEHSHEGKEPQYFILTGGAIQKGKSEENNEGDESGEDVIHLNPTKQDLAEFKETYSDNLEEKEDNQGRYSMHCSLYEVRLTDDEFVLNFSNLKIGQLKRGKNEEEEGSEERM